MKGSDNEMRIRKMNVEIVACKWWKMSGGKRKDAGDETNEGKFKQRGEKKNSYPGSLIRRKGRTVEKGEETKTRGNRENGEREKNSKPGFYYKTEERNSREKRSDKTKGNRENVETKKSKPGSLKRRRGK